MRNLFRGVMVLALALGVRASADQLTLVSGQVVTGQFAGFKNHRFLFQDSGGDERKEFAAGVKSLRVESPVRISVQFKSQTMDDVLFAGYEKFNVRLIRDGREFAEPATLLKQIDLAFDAQRTVGNPDGPAAPRTVESPEKGNVPRPVGSSGGFDAQRTVESPGVTVISRGEAVDIEKSLMRGRVNVVFFHFPSAHSSIRQGNYVEMLARETRGRVAILKLIIPRWEAPVCVERGLTSLPQFWFYSPSGRLVKKLTQRFTESDIDEAFKGAQRSP